MSEPVEPRTQERAELPECTAQYIEYLETLHFWPPEDERVRPGLEPDNLIYRQMPEDFSMENDTFKHADHMTRENLYGKWEIAAELGYRDARIADLETKLAAAERDAGRLDWCAENQATFHRHVSGGYFISVPDLKGGCDIWPTLGSTATVREAIDAATNQTGSNDRDSTEGVG